MARIEGASLNVTAQTTLQELKDFADTAGGVDGAKLRGTDNGDGTYTLYAVDNDSSLFSRISGTSRQRRDDARAAINFVFANNAGDSKLALKDVNSRVNYDGGRSPKAAMLKSLMDFTRSGRPEGQPEAKTGTMADARAAHEANKPPRVVPLAMSLRSDAVAQLATPSANSASMNTQIRTIDTIFEDLMPRIDTMPNNLKTELGVSRHLAGDIRAMMEPAMAGRDDPAASARLDIIAASVADRIQDRLNDTHQITENSFRRGDVTFTKVEQLGEPGAFGTATLYRGSDGSEVVLKAPSDTQLKRLGLEGAQDAFATEIIEHKKVEDARGDTATILKFEGAIRLQNGSFGILSEVAGGGDAVDAMFAVTNALKADTISVEQANAIRLTLAKDMLDGLKAMHDGGLMHRDFKLENVFIGGDGTAKVADFGTVREDTAYDTNILRDIDAPHFRPPEEHLKRKEIKAYDEQILSYNERLDAARTSAAQTLVGPGGLFEDIETYLGQGEFTIERILDSEIGEAFGAVLADLTRANLEQAYEGKGSEVVNYGSHPLLRPVPGQETGAQVLARLDGVAGNAPDTMVDSMNYDTWAAGIALLQLFTDGKVFDAKFAYRVQNHLEAWAVTGGNAVGPGSDLGLAPDGSGKELTTGIDALDDLLNVMLHKNPDTRANLNFAASRDVFTGPGVGSTEARNLLLALTKGEGIDAAKLALDATL